MSCLYTPPISFQYIGDMQTQNIAPQPLNQPTLTRSTTYHKEGNCYIGTNPRLFDSARAMYMPLKEPNLEVDFPLMTTDAIYKQPQQRSGLMQYEDIKYGQNQYYIDPQMNPFPHPIYVSQLPQHIFIHRDPMGQHRNEYRRFHYNEEFFGCQQETRDALLFREDLLENQSRKIANQQYTNLWLAQKSLNRNKN